MNPLSFSLALTCVLSVWTVERAAGCGHQQIEIDEQCCDLCPPGTFRKKLCSEHHQTVCSPCPDSSYSEKYHIFDRCEECQSCKQEYAEKCLPTKNANCSCTAGFLCSNNVCSNCVEIKCVTGENPYRKESPEGEYSYQCERVHDPQRNSSDSTLLILSIGFVLLSLTLLMLLLHACVGNLRKRKAYKNPTNIAAGTNTSDFHLSKEESGLTFILAQDESKNSGSFCQMQLMIESPPG